MSAEVSVNNKRIAKNTILLYIRMIFMMLISLYTSRVILSTLGEVDYGVYNVVGGFVSMFAIVTGALSYAISRFLTFELGKDNRERLNIVFSTSVSILVLLSLIIVVFCEIIGIWFVNYKMNIPESRILAANWVLQCTLLSFIVNLISVPYNACIIAHERMGAFAYISIAEAVLKLIIVFLLNISLSDKLIVYSILVLCVSLTIRLLYGIYCKRHFEECYFHFVMDKQLMKKMFSFTGWTFLGNGVGVLNTQGSNILINLFFGVTINAAKGIANSIESMLNLFINNFATSINPQITKSYANGDYEYFHSLVKRGSKFSFFLYLLIAVPLFLESDFLLSLWLVEVPSYTGLFVKWTIANTATTILGNSLIVAISANGDIKKYQIVASLWALLVLPVSYVAYRMGADVSAIYVVYFLVYFILIFIRMMLICEKIGMSFMDYFQDVIYVVFVTTILSIFLPLVVCFFMPNNLLRFLIVTLISILSTGFSILYVGMSINERKKTLSFVSKKIKSLKH